VVPETNVSFIAKSRETAGVVEREKTAESRTAYLRGEKDCAMKKEGVAKRLLFGAV